MFVFEYYNLNMNIILYMGVENWIVLDFQKN